jgi:hypothetical protein
MEVVRGLVERDRLVEGVWTGYSSALDRTLLKKRRYLNPEPPKPVEVPKPQAKPAAQPSSSPFAAKLQDALGHDN